MLKITNKFKKYYLQKSNILFWNNKPQEILKIAKNNKYIWFPDGKLNLYENCISKNLKKNKIAIITVNSEKKIKKYSYQQLDKKVNRMAEYLVKFSKNKKIRIMIHASASIESAVLMLTCAKLGFHFSVIFEELESLGIQNRIKLFKPNIFFTRLSHEVFKSKMNIKIQNKIKFVYKAKIQEIINKKTKKKP